MQHNRLAPGNYLPFLLLTTGWFFPFLFPPAPLAFFFPPEGFLAMLFLLLYYIFYNPYRTVGAILKQRILPGRNCFE